MGQKESDTIDSAGIRNASDQRINPATEETQLLVLNGVGSLYTVRIDEVDATTTYFGFAAVGSSTASAVWRIKRMTVSGTVTSILFADGNSNFDNVWDNRASLSYS